MIFPAVTGNDLSRMRSVPQSPQAQPTRLSQLPFEGRLHAEDAIHPHNRVMMGINKSIPLGPSMGGIDLRIGAEFRLDSKGGEPGPHIEASTACASDDADVVTQAGEPITLRRNSFLRCRVT